MDFISNNPRTHGKSSVQPTFTCKLQISKKNFQINIFSISSQIASYSLLQSTSLWLKIKTYIRNIKCDQFMLILALLRVVYSLSY